MGFIYDDLGYSLENTPLSLTNGELAFNYSLLKSIEWRWMVSLHDHRGLAGRILLDVGSEIVGFIAYMAIVFRGISP